MSLLSSDRLARWRQEGRRGLAALREKPLNYRVHLASDALMACELQGSVLRRKEQIGFAADGLDAALEALHLWMDEQSASARPRTRARQHWILGHEAVRYLLLPWNPELVDEELRLRFAQARFEQVFKVDVAAYRLAFGRARYGETLLLAGIEEGLLANLQQHARRNAVALASVRPALGQVWDVLGPSLAREGGVLGIVDGSRQWLVAHAHGQITHIALRPFDLRDPQAPVTSAQVTFPADVQSAGAAYAFALCGVQP